ncbi:MAG: hypothetical protein MI919_21020, partial [Holophagales bacterium]|nr:hypothetical protein [Holophagales bacterium]
ATQPARHRDSLFASEEERAVGPGRTSYGAHSLREEPPGTRAEADPADPRADAISSSQLPLHPMDDDGEEDVPFYRKALAQRHLDDSNGYGPNW